MELTRDWKDLTFRHVHPGHGQREGEGVYGERIGRFLRHVGLREFPEMVPEEKEGWVRRPSDRGQTGFGSSDRFVRLPRLVFPGVSSKID